MSSIDRRVVEMEFDNKQFENGIQDTLASLETLKNGLKLEGATKGLQDIDAAGKDVNLDGMAAGVENISSKFSALGAIGFTVIQSLTRGALDFVQRLSGMVWDPLATGGKKRAMNIEQAKFQFRGLKMDVEDTMASALAAVTGTAFGLDEAAKAAGMFGASGMRAGEEMTSSLRAIAGVAAMTNSTYTDTADIFTKVSGNGRLMGSDLLRMSSRGLNAAATLSDAMGVSEATVREMVTEGEISFKMFSDAMDDAFGENATKANETYTGSLANMKAALSRIGASFFTPFLKDQRDLFNSITPAIDAIAKALGPVIDMMIDFSGASTKGLISIIDSFDFSRLILVIAPMVRTVKNLGAAFASIIKPIREAFSQIFPSSSIMEFRKMVQVVEDFTETIKMGGDSAEKLKRTFAGVFAVFSIGWSVVKAVTVFLFDLFGMVSEGSGGFLDATANIGDFLVALDLAVKNGEGLAKFFEGLKDVIRGPIKFIKDLASALLSIFDFEAPSADNLTASFEPLGRLGEILISVWDRVLASLNRIWDVFQPLAEKLQSFFEPITNAITKAFTSLNFDQILDTLNTGLLGGIFLMFQRMAANTSNSVGSIAFNLTEPFRKMTFVLRSMQNTLRAATLMQLAIAIGILSASVLMLSKVDAEGLTKALTAMSVMMGQLVLSLKGLTMLGGAKGIVSIGAGLVLFAIAIRILASAVKALAELSWEELAKGLTGVTVLIGALVLAVRGMSSQTAGMIKAGAGLLLLAFGIKVLVSAVTDLSGLGWEEMAKGLVGVGALLGALTLFTKFSKANKGAIGQGAALVLLAVGIKILASAVKDFADLSWEEVGKGLASVTAILFAFAIFSRAVGNPAKLMAAGVSLVLVSVAMKILASAMSDIADLSWEEIDKGLSSMAGALILIVAALNLMPPSTLASAAALVVVSVALGLIANVMQQMGGMSWEEIAKGLVTLAGSLVIIAVAMMAMTAALPGAAATLLVAAALATLVPVLIAFGSMSLGMIAKGLGVMAGVFIILGVAGLALAAVVPVLLALGIAVGILGIGLLAAGAGVFLFATGITALAAAGAAGVAAIIAIAVGLFKLLPEFARQIGNALVAFAEVIAAAGPAMLDAMSAVLGAIIGAIEENVPRIIDLFTVLLDKLLELLVEFVPKIAEAALDIMIAILEAMVEKVPIIVAEIANLIVAILKELTEAVPKMVKAAAALLVAFLTELADNVQDVIDAGAAVIIALIEGISDSMVDIVDAGFEAIVSFIEGITDSIDEHMPELLSAGKDMAFAIADGLTGGIAGKVGEVARAARDMANNAIDTVKGWFESSSPSKVFERIGASGGQGLAIGFTNSAPLVNKAAGGVGKDAISTMKKSISGLSDLLAMDTDLNPTITPVLDLSGFHKDAAQINSSLSGKQISVDVAYSEAKYASTRYQANEAARYATTTAGDISSPAELTFNQYNNSPKALSSAEIYRQTKNQLSVTKGALTPNVAQDA